jgi:hypothetical protein
MKNSYIKRALSRVNGYMYWGFPFSLEIPFVFSNYSPFIATVSGIIARNYGSEETFAERITFADLGGGIRA